MRLASILLLLACGTASAFQKIAFDERPFGKYLVGVCSVTTEAVNCSRLDSPADGIVTAHPAPPAPEPQAISMKLACAPGAASCPPITIVAPGDFYVRATTDSGQQVNFRVVSNNATQDDTSPPGGGVQRFHVSSPGIVVIEASADGNTEFAAPVPVELVLTVTDKSSDASPLPSDPGCMGLFPSSASPVTSIQPRIDLTELTTLLGNPTPFTLTPAGPDQIFVYSSRFPLNDNEKKIARTIPGMIAHLAQQTKIALGVMPAAKAFKVELTIPHAAALGDLAARINGLNYSPFTVQDIGSDKVRISAAQQPDCDTWSAFLSAIRHMQWQLDPQPFEERLFYLAANDVVTAFIGLTGSATPPAASPAPSGAAPAGNTTPAGDATVAVTQPPGSVVEIKSNTTPCVVAGLTLGNSGACASASTPAASPASGSPSAGGGGSSGAAAQPKPPSMAAVPVVNGAGQQGLSDLLVFSDSNQGDDAQVEERKRILAVLDLPRPEMIVNAWVMQNSTASPQAMGMFSGTVRGLVDGYNEAVQKLILNAWVAVQKETRDENYFNRPFYSYIADRFIAEPQPLVAAKDPATAAQQFLDTSPAIMSDDPNLLREDFGICKTNRYCLGYNSLFHPLKPRLTDVLLTLVAANAPRDRVKETIRSVQQADPEANAPGGRICDYPARGAFLGRDALIRCRAIWSNLGLDHDYGCASTDHRFLLGSLSDSADAPPAHLHLACFWEAADILMKRPEPMRAAIADFLFNYKMSQQYPHEFVAYDLSQSADALNAALSPLIDAFNRDVAAFQNFMRADLQYQVDRLNSGADQRCCVKRLFGIDKPSFFNDGLITVRTISGQPTVVNTTSQSFLDASSAPTAAALLNNIAAGGSASSTTSPLAGVLGKGAQPGAALLGGVLNSYQTTYAQVGRALNLTVTPRSLATASAAEMSVSLMADDSSGGTTYSGGPAGAQSPNTSHVATHDTTTRVRVESIKLFELSSFSAVLERSRSRFPLLPPFVELPYIGTLAGIPIPGAKEYHASTAVISALVVPTAADIAYGLRFSSDQVLDGDAGPCSFLRNSAGNDSTNPCRFRRAVALRDLNRAPIRTFHRYMLNCLETNMGSPYTGIASMGAREPAPACTELTFDKVPQDAP